MCKGRCILRYVNLSRGTFHEEEMPLINVRTIANDGRFQILSGLHLGEQEVKK